MSHCVYLLYCKRRNETYIGYSKNITQRIEQHKTGGAKYTRQFHGKFEVICFVSRFKNQKQALQFEYAWKHSRPIAVGLSGRIKRLHELFTIKYHRWTTKAVSLLDQHDADFTIHWNCLDVLPNIEYLVSVQHI